MAFFADVGRRGIPEKLSGLTLGKVRIAVLEILADLLLIEPELTALITGEPADEMAQFQTSAGLDDDPGMHLRDGPLMVLEKPERTHPPVPNEHMLLVSDLFGLCVCIFRHSFYLEYVEPQAILSRNADCIRIRKI